MVLQENDDAMKRIRIVFNKYIYKKSHKIISFSVNKKSADRFVTQGEQKLLLREKKLLLAEKNNELLQALLLQTTAQREEDRRFKDNVLALLEKVFAEVLKRICKL